MIERLILFGATGDLAGRYLLPALAALHAAGRLPSGFEIRCASSDDIDDEAYRRLARQRLDEHGADLPASAREAFVSSLRYQTVDVTDPEQVASLVAPGGGPVAAYLALPPALYPATVTALGSAGLATGSRIILEKPFGMDLAAAITLNGLLADVLGPAAEQAVFRVDHVLGMATTENLLAMRLANPFLETVWSSDHVEEVEILWEETLGLEGRAGYYDRAGALKDVLQNHMLQLLCLVAMEPASGVEAASLHDLKLTALRGIRPLTPADAAARSRRGRYTAGRLATGSDVPDYAEEDGVDPERGTETFAEVVLEVDTPRWAGTRFVLRAGKALAQQRKGMVLKFRSSPSASTSDIERSALWIGIDGPEDIVLGLTGGTVFPPRSLPLALTGELPDTGLPAYGRVLVDALEGGRALSVSGAEAEESWRVVAPVLEAWADGSVPLEDYRAGTSGPAGSSGSGG
jgi:glucose-6-phosphate 1-dehydrogenase